MRQDAFKCFLDVMPIVVSVNQYAYKRIAHVLIYRAKTLSREGTAVPQPVALIRFERVS